MFKSEEMILEQDGNTLQRRGRSGRRAITPKILYALRVLCVESPQLFSLLARFQEMSSPMVELVLETGCL